MSFRPRALMAALAAVPPLTIALASLPAVAWAEPMVIDCHTDTTFTPTLPGSLHDVQSTQPTSSDPSVVRVHLLRKGGGTDGSIELTAQGKGGSVSIEWAVKDTYTGEVQRLRLNVEVYCGPPPGKGKTGGGIVGGGVVVDPVPPGGGSGQNGDPTPGGGRTATHSGLHKSYPRATHVTTSCAICHATVESLNEEIDAYNDLIDKGAPPAQIEEMRAAMNATANALAACEKRCRAPIVPSTTTTPDGRATTEQTLVQPVSGQVTAPTDKPSTPTTGGLVRVQPASGKATSSVEPSKAVHPSTTSTKATLPTRSALTVPGAAKPVTGACPAGQTPVTVGGKTSCKPKATALVDGVS